MLASSVCAHLPLKLYISVVKAWLSLGTREKITFWIKIPGCLMTNIISVQTAGFVTRNTVSVTAAETVLFFVHRNCKFGQFCDCIAVLIGVSAMGKTFVVADINH